MKRFGKEKVQLQEQLADSRAKLEAVNTSYDEDMKKWTEQRELLEKELTANTTFWQTQHRIVQSENERLRGINANLRLQLQGENVNTAKHVVALTGWLQITTVNSGYKITANADDFTIVKTHELRPSGFMLIGESRRSKTLTIEVGKSAIFDGWQTSPVTKIEICK